MDMNKDVKVHQIVNPGFRQQKQPTRMERLERAVKQLASLPQFLLQKFQDLAKVVEDLRFTYEIIGILLMEKNLITQDEMNIVGKRLVEERRKAREEGIKVMKDEAEKRTADMKNAMDENREPLNGVGGEVLGTIPSEKIVSELKTGGVKDEDIEEVAHNLMKSREDLKEQQVQDTDVSIKRLPENDK